MTMYAISANVENLTSDGYRASRQVPTFYLNSNVQGIVSAEHAEKIAEDIFRSTLGEHQNDGFTFHISVYTLDNYDLERLAE